MRVPPAPLLGTIREASLICDICGGDSFSDIYGLWRFLLNYLLWLVIHNMGRRVVHLPQTYGPCTSLTARLIARHILGHASWIIARDTHSRREARKLLHKDAGVVLSPDVAFILPAVRPGRLTLVDQAGTSTHALPDQFVGFNINGLMLNGGYTGNNQFGLRVNYPDFILSCIHVILTETDYGIVLIPHTITEGINPESDNLANASIMQRIGGEGAGRLLRLESMHGCNGVKWVITQSRFFIGSRMHACIGALSQGVPCVGFAYSPKFSGVFATVGMEDHIIDGRTATLESALESVRRALKDREHTRLLLDRRIPETSESLRRVFALL